MPATVIPRRAATLMRPRSSGVMSMVSRAVKVSPLPLAFASGVGARTQAHGSLRRSENAFPIAAIHRARLSTSTV